MDWWFYSSCYILYDHSHEMAAPSVVLTSANAAYGMVKQGLEDDYEAVDGPQGEQEVPSFPPHDQSTKNVGDEMYEPIPGEN